MKVETLNFLSFFKIIFSIVMFRDEDTTFDKEYRNRAPTRAYINYTYVMNSVLWDSQTNRRRLAPWV